MTISTAPGWDDPSNHQVVGMNEAALIDLVADTLASCAKTCKEKSILQMCNAAGAKAMWSVKISKGLHQEDGNMIMTEKHVTIDEPDFPYPKRYHLYFMHFGEKRGPGRWLATRITHVTYGNEGKAIASVSL